jgi:transketolase
VEDLAAVANRLRVRILEACCAAGGGHLGGAFSVVDILVALYDHMIFDPHDPGWEQRDRLIFSKGHSCLALYACLEEHGFFGPEVLDNYGKNGALVGGHPKRGSVPGVEVTSGSLGHGLALAAGMALAARSEDHDVYCVLSDGEMNEGSTWEAVMFAAHHKLNNLVAVVDNNKMLSLDQTESILGVAPLRDRLAAFGWHAVVADGHNIGLISDLLSVPTIPEGPTAIIANTTKGKGVSFMENSAKWHYRCPTPEGKALALKELMT